MVSLNAAKSPGLPGVPTVPSEAKNFPAILTSPLASTENFDCPADLTENK